MKEKNVENKIKFQYQLRFVRICLQTVNETVTICLKVALRYFVPLAAKRFLEVINTLAFFSNNLAFQNTSGTIVQRIGNRRFWWPLCGGNDFFNHSWVVHAECDGAESCWNVQGPWPKFLHVQGFNALSSTFSR